MICFGLFIMYCELPRQVPINGYCQTYIQIIQEKGDGKISGKLSVKQRIDANEQTFRRLCKK